jgi:hypothetical protein
VQVFCRCPLGVGFRKKPTPRSTSSWRGGSERLRLPLGFPPLDGWIGPQDFGRRFGPPPQTSIASFGSSDARELQARNKHPGPHNVAGLSLTGYIARGVDGLSEVIGPSLSLLRSTQQIVDIVRALVLYVLVIVESSIK